LAVYEILENDIASHLDLKRWGRRPYPPYSIYTQSYTFCGGNGCIPVSAAALKSLKHINRR